MNLHTTAIDRHSWECISPEDKRSIERLLNLGTWAAMECGCVNTTAHGNATDARCPATWSRLANNEVDPTPECQHPEVCYGHR